MDSYQGSTPLNFILFQLENLPKKNVRVPTTSQANDHATPEDSSSDLIGLRAGNTGGFTVQSLVNIEKDSPANSQGSSTDVTAYAEAVVQRMEQQQEIVAQQVGASITGSNDDGPPNTEATSKAPNAPEVRRSSTPILSEEGEETCQADLSALESALHVIFTSESQLPELRDRTGPESANVSGAPSRTDEENASSICDAPALPGGAHQVHFLGEQSDEEKTVEETSLVNPVALYGFNPFHTESGTEGGDETNSEILIPGTSKNPAPSSQPSHS